MDGSKIVLISLLEVVCT